MRERRRHRALADTRLALNEAKFADQMMMAGVDQSVAAFLWAELAPYYFKPLTPYPTDRLYSDLGIDPNDLSDTAIRFEQQFEAWLGDALLATSDDPTILEIGVTLDAART